MFCSIPDSCLLRVHRCHSLLPIAVTRFCPSLSLAVTRLCPSLSLAFAHRCHSLLSIAVTSFCSSLTFARHITVTRVVYNCHLLTHYMAVARSVCRCYSPGLSLSLGQYIAVTHPVYLCHLVSSSCVVTNCFTTVTRTTNRVNRSILLIITRFEFGSRDSLLTPMTSSI